MRTALALGVATTWGSGVSAMATGRLFDPSSTLWEYDDFVSGAAATNAHGKLNWTGLSGGQAPTQQTGEAGHPGISRLSSGALANSFSYSVMSYSAGGLQAVLGTELWDCLFVWRQVTPDTTNGVRIGIGVGAVGGQPSAGAYAEKLPADTSYYPVTRATGTETKGAAFAAADASWHKLRVRRIDASSVGFTFDAAAEVVHTTNLPTVALSVFYQVTNSSSNALARSIDVDYADIVVSGLAR